MNYELRIKNKTKERKFINLQSRGFTLIELLAVVVVVAAVAAVAGGIITTSLRGTNKTNAITDVQQNGNYALSQMARMILYAKSFDGVSTDGVHFTTNCTQTSAVSPTPTPTQYQALAIINPDDQRTVLNCVPASNTTSATVASQSGTTSIPVIDTTTVSVVAQSCYFTCLQQTIVDSPIIGINFTLQKPGATSSFFETSAPLTFQTTVIMRNSNR